MKEIERLVAETVMERPVAFRIDKAVLYIYPMTLGKMYIFQEVMEHLGLVTDNVEKNVYVELLRITQESKDSVCELLSYMTARNEYYDVFDIDGIERRKKLIMSMGEADVASLFMLMLTADRTRVISKQLGIDDEQKNMRKVMKVKEKSDKNSLSFGGVSIFGSLIDTAMERYKMTKRQVVWEIDYASLRLLLADRVNTVYVTDEERKKIHIPKDRTKINGDDKEALINAIKSQSWE